MGKIGKTMRFFVKIALLITLAASLCFAAVFAGCGAQGEKGENGKSAYELAKDNGYTGTEKQWLDSLTGENGKDGANGKSAYELAKENGYTGTEKQWLASLAGEKGKDGTNGKSAYELAKENGYMGTEEQWLLSLVGAKGADGANGKDGVNGKDGANGKSAYELAKENGYTGTLTEWFASLAGENGSDGANGKSAYEIAKENGYTGTEEQWLLSLVGAKGDKGDKGSDGKNGTNGKSAYELAKENGYTGTLTEWLADILEKRGADGKDGENGKSAYELAKENGYTGTEEEWLASLVGAKGDKGDKGEDGTNGKSAYELAKENGYTGTVTEWLASLAGENGTDGVNGKSAYELAKENGYTGTLTEWLTSLVGAKGDKGDTGVGIRDIQIDYSGRVTITLTDGRVETITVTASCEHENISKTIVKPTCSARGYTAYKCEKCGYSYKNDFVPATGHHYYNRFCVFCSEEEKFGEIAVNTDWYYSGNYTIKTKEELAGFAYIVNTGVTNFSGSTVKLGANIDISESEWVPIGTETAPFAGTFDGQNLTVTGLQITNSELTANIGFFGYVSGTIKNFNIKNANVSSELTGNNIGIACGYSAGLVSGISVSGYLTAEHFTNVGGVVGTVYYKGNGNYTELHNTADVTGKEYVGGVAGKLHAYTSMSSLATTVGIFSNKGNITATGDYVGGVCGYLKRSDNRYDPALNVNEFSNEGSVTTKGNYVGGIAGYVYGTSTASYMKICSNNSSVEGKAYVGGIAGKTENVTIDNCDNTGTTLSAKFITEDNSLAYLGGYVGYGYSIKNCDNAVNIDYTYEAYYIGGIAGYLTNVISACSNSGVINAPKASYVGGVVGNVYYKGDGNYTELHNTADVTGKEYVGGVAGKLHAYTSLNSLATKVGNFSNKGNITATGDYVGGVCGYLKRSDDRYEPALNVNELSNKGSVTSSGNYVGGIAVYVYAISGSGSYMKTCSNTSSVEGKAYVGGIVGKAENTTVDNCDNTGTTLSAKFITEDNSKAYLGGYVGYGYSVKNCNNTVNINYTYEAFYVGGVAGYLINVISACSNSGVINAPRASYVGGVVGNVYYKGDGNYTELHNTADVTGKEYVGGVAGKLHAYTSLSMVATTVGNFSNKGNITATGDYVGGLCGYLKRSDDRYDPALYANELSNEGSVTTKGNYVGGIAGYVYAMSGTNSYMKTCANSGSVNGNANVGEIVGYSENITIN